MTTTTHKISILTLALPLDSVCLLARLLPSFGMSFLVCKTSCFSSLIFFYHKVQSFTIKLFPQNVFMSTIKPEGLNTNS